MTKEELLFLYLRDHVYKRRNDAILISLTMQEIRRELNCTLGYLSRLLHSNEKRRFIRRKSIKIPSKNRKINIFILTKKGRRLAKKIHEYAIGNKK